MKQIDQKKLKNEGFIKQVEKEYYSMRLRIAGGRIDSGHLKKVYEIAQKYGRGYVHLTARQSVEIPFIKLEDISSLREELSDAGIEAAACGPRVRTVTACYGCKICKWGLIDSQEVAAMFDRRYYGKDVPHKFKLGITGCRNNCLKAEENDLGVKGAVKPQYTEEACRFCGLCQGICPVQAISVIKDDKKLLYRENECINCGKCIKVCPANAWNGVSGFIVYFGGLYGNKISIGKQLLPIIYSLDELHLIVESTLEFFKKYGKKSERFANTLNRVGWGLLKSELQEVLKQTN